VVACLGCGGQGGLKQLFGAFMGKSKIRGPKGAQPGSA
jgi:hypothetical protein